jgi:hypothetical protein
MALLLALSSVAQAQTPRPEPINRLESAPSLVLALSPGQIRKLSVEFDEDLRALDAFAGAPDADRISRSPERPGRWTLYGRLGLLNFRNQMDEADEDGMRFGLKRSGPRLTGKIYVGIHRRW